MARWQITRSLQHVGCPGNITKYKKIGSAGKVFKSGSDISKLDEPAAVMMISLTLLLKTMLNALSGIKRNKCGYLLNSVNSRFVRRKRLND